MIVRDRPHGLALFFLLRGSILPRVLPTLLVNIGFASLVTALHGSLLDHKLQVTMAPFSLIGLALAIFLGFRNNAAYDRYWEARKLWGEMIHGSRSWSRQVTGWIQPGQALDWRAGLADVRVRLVWRAIAVAHALRHQLRGSPPGPEVTRWLGAEDAAAFAAARSGPQCLLQQQGRELGRCLADGSLPPSLAEALDRTLSVLGAASAGCERIKGTPVPFPYTLLLHRTATLYCFLLPFGLVDQLHGLTPLVVALVAYTFFGLDAVGDEIEEPFGTRANDLPLDALCAAIELDLRESLGEPDLPPAPQPRDFLLT